MKRFFFTFLSILTLTMSADSKKEVKVQAYPVEYIYYPLETNLSVQAERTYNKQENLGIIKFNNFPTNIKNKLYALKFYHKPNRFYAVKEYGLDKKLKFTHKFLKQINGWLYKGYYLHQPNEKIQASKILYEIIIFNLDGQILSKSNFDKFHKLTPDDSGIVTYTNVYDSHGNLVQQVNRDWKMRVRPDKEGFGIRNFTYDKMHRLISKTFYRKEGVPTGIEGNISKVEYAYDETCFEKSGLVGGKLKKNNLTLTNKSINVSDFFLNETCIHSIKHMEFSKELMGYKPAINTLSFLYDASGNFIGRETVQIKKEIKAKANGEYNPETPKINFSFFSDKILKSIAQFGKEQEKLAPSNQVILKLLKESGIPLNINKNESNKVTKDSKTGYETTIFYDSQNLIKARTRRDEKVLIEKETFHKNGNLASFDYSLNFYLSEGKSFHLKLDQFKRPVSIEFFSNEK